MTSKLARVFAIGASGAVLLGGMLVVAPVASASAQGCTGTNLRTDPALLCTTVDGESTTVKNIQASIDIKNYTCNADFKVWGTYADGRKYSDTGHAKCGLGRVWVDFKPSGGKFKNGTKVCSALVENGKVRAEHACIEIKK
ncbi:hypothetical protein AB0L88_10535 [Saccharopolyspora shandongensis]|uniref:hypothetical protein n=1 Tax=Saccharopolyspora shandongensis TaxID=418495 RepID=UPI003412F1B4